MNLLPKIAFAALVFSQVASPQWSALEGTKADWKTGKSRQEAHKIEDERYKDALAGLDKMYRHIGADWEIDAQACGNDAKTTSSCMQAAIQKRDRQLKTERALRIQASTLHFDQCDEIDRFWSKKGVAPVK
jgi:hypothetical protein